MDNNKIIDIIAYYLSEYDMQAFLFLGYSVQSQGFREISQYFEKKDSYLRRLRDEYDVVTSSHRNGQRNRPPRQRIKDVANHLSSFSFDELSNIVRALIANAKTELNNSLQLSVNKTYSMKELSEEEIENIINFKDENAYIKITNGNQQRRIYNTAIIAQLKILYHGCCQICGVKPFPNTDIDISEVHHIDYFSTSQNNNAKNLIVLCPNHHRFIHKTNPTYNKNEKTFIFANGDVEHIILDYHLDGDIYNGSV